jgi:hypothetical protein
MFYACQAIFVMENFKIKNKKHFEAGGKREVVGDDKLTFFLWGLMYCCDFLPSWSTSQLNHLQNKPNHFLINTMYRSLQLHYLCIYTVISI